jgi:hypothetical protein
MSEWIQGKAGFRPSYCPYCLRELVLPMDCAPPEVIKCSDCGKRWVLIDEFTRQIAASSRGPTKATAQPGGAANSSKETGKNA